MGDGDIRERLPQIHPMGESTVNEVVPRRLRGQTLFYADAVNVLRTIYPTKDYSYLVSVAESKKVLKRTGAPAICEVY
jgi:hypothetical protein